LRMFARSPPSRANLMHWTKRPCACPLSWQQRLDLGPSGVVPAEQQAHLQLHWPLPRIPVHTRQRLSSSSACAYSATPLVIGLRLSLVISCRRGSWWCPAVVNHWAEDVFEHGPCIASAGPLRRSKVPRTSRNKKNGKKLKQHDDFATPVSWQIVITPAAS